MQAPDRRAGPRHTAALRAALPCRSDLLKFTNEFDTFERQMLESYGPQNAFERRRSAAFEHSLLAASFEGAWLSLEAHSPFFAQYAESSMRILVMPYAGRIKGERDGDAYEVSIDAGAMIDSGASVIAEAGEAASAVFAFSHATLESHVGAISGREETRLPADDLRISPEVLEKTGRGALFASAVRMVTEAQATPGLLGQAQALDLLMRATALMTIDALRLPERASTGSDASRAVRLARDYMIRRLAEECTLTDIERAAGVSRRTLQLHFLKTYGLSPMQYLREQRLLRAREMLASGRCAGVTEAALGSGFTHLSSFSALYRARFGAAPREALRR